MSSTFVSTFSGGIDLETDYEYKITKPETLVPVTTLGRGSYGKVVLASINENGEELLVAVKVVAKSRLKTKTHVEKAVSELNVMNQVKSRFLVRSLGAYQTDDALYYTMPYSSGGELFFHLQRMGRFRESRARILIMHVVLGLQHLHEHGILYRDLKPENILITGSGRAQIADFGLAKFLPRLVPAAASPSDPRKSTVSIDSSSSKQQSAGISFRRFCDGEKSVDSKNAADSGGSPDNKTDEIWGTTKTRCGTPAYQAPEIVLAPEGQVHGLEADWWALGVLSYEIIVGDPPFMAQSIKEVYELILRNKIVFPKKMSEVAQQFVLDLTRSDRKQRLGYGKIDAQAVRAHPFFKVDKTPSWETVENWTCSPPVDLSEVNLGASPRDAVFFHAEFTSEDVREYIPPPKSGNVHQPAEFKGFSKVPNATFEQFISTTPVSVITKADAAAAAAMAEADGEKKQPK